jgi:hypothetical protein
VTSGALHSPLILGVGPRVPAVPLPGEVGAHALDRLDQAVIRDR